MSEPKWIPIEQQEPQESDYYLVFFPASEEFGNEDIIDICFWWYDSFVGGGISYEESKMKYTHWMPLPEPPKGKWS